MDLTPEQERALMGFLKGEQPHGYEVQIYGEPMSADSEGDLYAMITGRRSPVLDSPASMAAINSQAMDFGALDAYWDAFRRDSEDIGAITPAPKPDNTTAPSCSSLTTAALDGERLGRLSWTPGAR